MKLLTMFMLAATCWIVGCAALGWHEATIHIVGSDGGGALDAGAE